MMKTTNTYINLPPSDIFKIVFGIIPPEFEVISKITPGTRYKHYDSIFERYKIAKETMYYIPDCLPAYYESRTYFTRSQVIKELGFDPEDKNQNQSKYCVKIFYKNIEEPIEKIFKTEIERENWVSSICPDFKQFIDVS